jgi:hypothetical protein
VKEKLTPEEYKRFLYWKKRVEKAQRKIDKKKANKKMNLFFSSMIRE